MDNSIGLVLFSGVILFIIIVIMRFHNTSGADMISDNLREKGAKPKLISREWVDADRNTMTYRVEYIDTNGNNISSRCKIRYTGLFLDKEIFWLDSENSGVATDFTKALNEKKRSKKNPSLSELQIRKTKKIKSKAGNRTKVINKSKNNR